MFVLASELEGEPVQQIEYKSGAMAGREYPLWTTRSSVSRSLWVAWAEGSAGVDE